MFSSNFHVIIVGGGIGGLCLAHGLKKSGVSVAVYERDHSSVSRSQGYRINIDESGSHALAQCLPNHLYEYFLSACAQPAKSYDIYTEKMKKLCSVRNEGKEIDSAIKPVNRMTLRQILVSDLDEMINFNKKFTHYEKNGEGHVTVFFEDGTRAEGNVLIAADGVHSNVRKQFLPHASRIDTGIRSIVGKIPLTERTYKMLSADASSIVAPKGVQMSFTMQEFKQLSNGGKDTLDIENPPDYIMWGIFGGKEKFPGEIEDMDSAELHDTVMEMIQDWHPELKKLLHYNDAGSVKLFPIYSSSPVNHWETTNITLLGDAIHSMTPMLGKGANMALQDAQLLCDRLRQVHHGEQTLLRSLNDYETEMLNYSFEAVHQSLQAAKQATSESLVSNLFMKTFFRLINIMPYFKYQMFRF